MINLLPPQEKEKLLMEVNKRITIILGIIVLIPLVSLVMVLLSIKFYILGEINSNKLVLQQAQAQYQTSSFLEFKGIIQKSNTTLVNLRSFYKKEVYVSQILKIISGISRPEDLYVTTLLLDRTENQKIKATISGFSKSRDDLITFQKNIQQDKRIENIYFSPESWVEAQNVKFYLTFEISK